MADTRYHNNQLILQSKDTEPGEVSWRSPSNLALVKYWGKHGVQLPRNPSVSFTLDQAFTDFTVEWKIKESNERAISLELFFDMIRNEAFEEPLIKKLEGLTDIFPFLHQLDLSIQTSNSFPHSSGIASSASSMSALALCLCTMEDMFFGTLEDDDAFEQKASYVARLASGSASRSIYSSAAVWGQSSYVEGSSDLYAVPVEEKLHDVFKTYQNAILVVSTGAKAISSSIGHDMMNDNPYADPRYDQAKQRFSNMMAALGSGDTERFGSLVEQEALTLHALMMASNPGYMLMEPASIALINKIKAFRSETGIQAYFSLDAGPNIHMLYPEADKEKVMDFIITDLSLHCQNGLFIDDKVGQGPVQL